jgi:hypothetical protein
VTVDVTLSGDGQNAVTDVYINGISVLRLVDPDYDTPEKMYQRYTRSSFEMSLSEDMLVPSHLLTFTYDRAGRPGDAVKFPYGYMVTKTT